MTASERAGSMVNFVRSQSHDAPSLRSCCRMMPPCSSFHSQAYFRNSSRVRSSLDIPISLSLATTLLSVAMDAWSVPGTQQAFFPSIRALRTSTSLSVLLSTCPIWRIPVTLGGGMTMVYGSLSSGSEWKHLCSSHQAYHLSSTSAGLYFAESSFFSLIFPLTTFKKYKYSTIFTKFVFPTAGAACYGDQNPRIWQRTKKSVWRSSQKSQRATTRTLQS